jgi:NitT/TauT family transport system permease protein/sulfonate transport system permease protein
MPSAPASASRVRAHRPWPARISLARVLGLLLIAGLLLLWQLSVRQRWIVSDSWPAISDVLRAGAEGIVSGELLVVLGSTLARAGVGYTCGVLAGAGLGLAFAMSSLARRLLSPAVEILRPIPVPALVPPLVLLLGVNDPMKITVVALTVVFPVLTNMVQGVLAVDGVLIAVARTFHVSQAATTLKVIFPAALPFLLAGMRISLALALIVTVVAEMIAGNQGIGHYLILMQYAVRPQDMYAGIMLLALSGYLLNKLFTLVEQRLIHWYSQVESRAVLA